METLNFKRKLGNHIAPVLSCNCGLEMVLLLYIYIYICFPSVCLFRRRKASIIDRTLGQRITKSTCTAPLLSVRLVQIILLQWCEETKYRNEITRYEDYKENEWDAFRCGCLRFAWTCATCATFERDLSEVVRIMTRTASNRSFFQTKPVR